MAGSQNVPRKTTGRRSAKNNTGHSKLSKHTRPDAAEIAASRAWNAAAMRRLLAGDAEHDGKVNTATPRRDQAGNRSFSASVGLVAFSTDLNPLLPLACANY
jgi:hypothetical protein